MVTETASGSGLSDGATSTASCVSRLTCSATSNREYMYRDRTGRVDVFGDVPVSYFARYDTSDISDGDEAIDHRCCCTLVRRRVAQPWHVLSPFVRFDSRASCGRAARFCPGWVRSCFRRLAGIRRNCRVDRRTIELPESFPSLHRLGRQPARAGGLCDAVYVVEAISRQRGLLSPRTCGLDLRCACRSAGDTTARYDLSLVDTW